MSGRNWTSEQMEAINSRGNNLLVAAAAGAGKTAVLVERIIRRITEPTSPLDVDRLLVVTFTNAAAAEMRERIGAAIARELESNPLSVHLVKQTTLLQRASITTLHSFCLDVLRRHFYRLDMDPSFRIADDAEAALLRMEVLEEVLEECYERMEEDCAFADLADAYGGERDDGKLLETVLGLYEFARSNPRPLEWLNKVAASFDLSDEVCIDELSWCRDIMDGIALELESVEDMLQAALEAARRPEGPGAYCQNLQDDLSLAHDLKLAGSSSWRALYQAFQGVNFKRLKACKGDVDEALKNKVKDLRDKAKEKIKNLGGGILARKPEELCLDIKKLAPLVKALVDLTVDFDRAYRRAKLDRGLVDFGDLEHYCLEILLDSDVGAATSSDNLAHSPVALELRERFEEILVDEYQDINAVQETILQLVSRQGNNGSGSNLFMVGDVKQSIYRFRLADPGLFLKKYNDYKPGGVESGQRIDLAKNFRSRQEVVDAVNFIFRQVMTPRVGEIAYDKQAELVYGADYPAVPGDFPAPNPVELHLLERTIQNGTMQNGNAIGKTSLPNSVEPLNELNWDELDEHATGDNGEYQGHLADLEELDATQREARLVARRIRELLECNGAEPPFKVYDKERGSYRQAAYKDIVVLLRSTRNKANIFLQEFRQWGIPAYADLGTGYFDAVEVETLLALLKIIDNPRQDVPLAGVLRSPIVGLNAEELAEIRLTSINGDFYTAVRGAARAGRGELSEKLQSFLNKLENWRTMARRGTLADLIWDIYRVTGYYDYVGSMPGGGQRQANLRALHDRARQYEVTTFRGLFRFLRFIERLQESGGDMGAARAMGENEDVVRVMSIHKSKGLEFPVVIVADLGKQFNMKDLNKDMLMHQELGLGPAFIDSKVRLSYPTLPKQAIRRRLLMELLAEEMRVLYVALTRAREKLILTGSVRSLEKAAARWCKNLARKEWALPEADLIEAKTPLDWLCSAVARHPDGQPLRRLADAGETMSLAKIQDASRWRVYLWDVPDGLPVQQELEGSQRQLLERVRVMEPVEAAGAYRDAVSAYLSWSYPQKYLLGIPAKISVTEMKRRFDAMYAGEEASPVLYRSKISARPGFIQESGGLTGAELGTAVHLVMQHVNLRLAPDVENIRKQLAVMQLQELLTVEQAEAVDVERVAEFFAGPLGRRILTAPDVKREVPFSLAVPVHEVYPDIVLEKNKGDLDETVLVQGVIDCLLDEGDGLVVVDYKTDRVDAGRLEKMTDLYRVQLNIYARAAETILKRPVKEKYLYLFYYNKIVKV